MVYVYSEGLTVVVYVYSERLTVVVYFYSEGLTVVVLVYSERLTAVVDGSGQNRRQEVTHLATVVTEIGLEAQLHYIKLHVLCQLLGLTAGLGFFII